MAKSKHGTLVANTVASVAITDHGGHLEIVNRSGTGEIWARFDGTNPVAEADDTFVIVGARRFPIVNLAITDVTTVTVKLISTAALKYSVEGANL